MLDSLTVTKVKSERKGAIGEVGCLLPVLWGCLECGLLVGVGVGVEEIEIGVDPGEKVELEKKLPHPHLGLEHFQPLPSLHLFPLHSHHPHPHALQQKGNLLDYSPSANQHPILAEVAHYPIHATG